MRRSEEKWDGEATDPENCNTGVADDLTQKRDSISGSVEGSRGIGRASLLEVLNLNRISRLDVPAACASQGAMECLKVEQSPQEFIYFQHENLLPSSHKQL